MAIVDLVPGVGKAVTLLGGMAAAKDAAVEYDPGCEPLEIIGNAGMLEELWMSLIGNALGAVPAGGRVEVAVGRRQRCGVVSIRDNGAGIPAAGLDRLGTPFYTTKATGSGLGVSIAYNIVHRHRGTIEYCSEAGQGTTVSVTLPLA